ncbi:MAG: tRNA pseudouridine(38-40) synthase TruA [Candidatus Magnetoovum sp. WYHC-5]|nr:tRNA pseudouridine(38-40) synthase TruA [Candidatus Magnetoovum sp. WYHC-5]
MNKICLTIQYDGTNYKGWQRQPDTVTIQGALESALVRICGEDISVISSGRTDTGVHALCQSATFSTISVHSPQVFMRALNAILPRDIRILDAYAVPLDFHPRYNAQKKRYFYIIKNDHIESALLDRYLWQIKKTLDMEKIVEASRRIIGIHDFKAFSAANSDIKESVREVFIVDIEQLNSINFMFTNLTGNFIKITIEANGFLRHMVRNIVGTLVEVGKYKILPHQIDSILKSKDRKTAGPTAPAKGLFLEKVYY